MNYITRDGWAVEESVDINEFLGSKRNRAKALLKEKPEFHTRLNNFFSINAQFMRQDHRERLKTLRVPVVPHLDAKILHLVDNNQGILDMSGWHNNHCGTSHCLAGWATTLGGDLGMKLEANLSYSLSGALIYLVSTGRIPNFYAEDEDALDELREFAAIDPLT